MQLNVSYSFTLETLSWKNHVIFYSQYFWKFRLSNSIKEFFEGRIESVSLTIPLMNTMPALIEPIHVTVMRT